MTSKTVRTTLLASLLMGTTMMLPAHADWKTPSPEAIELAQSTIILDGHVDIPYRIAASGEDISVRTAKGDFDYVRATEGGLNAPFMSNSYMPL